MEAWEEAGLSRDEYDEAMHEMVEDLGLDAPPSDAEMMGMHIQHVLDDVIEQGVRDGFTVDTWSEVAQALDEGDVLRTEYPDEAPADLVRRIFDFAYENGYDPEAYGAGSVQDWADRRGRDIAARDGRTWPVGAGFGMEPAAVEPIDADSVHAARFDEMLDYCIEHDEPWSKALGDELNRKVIEERDAIEQAAYDSAMAEEVIRADAAVIDDIRQRDGINGDEPDIPAYQARQYGYGRSREDMLAEADELGEQTGRTYVADMRAFYRRVYAYGNRDFSVVPDAVKGDMPTSAFAVRTATYHELGDNYADFYRDMLQDYAREKQREAAGVDFSKSVATVSEAAPAVEADKAKPVADLHRPYEYTPHFSGMSPDGPSGEYGDD